MGDDDRASQTFASLLFMSPIPFRGEHRKLKVLVFPDDVVLKALPIRSWKMHVHIAMRSL